MRARGRGGRQGPRGETVPPRALLAFMGRLCAQVPFRARGGGPMRRFLPCSAVSYARPLLRSRG